jgi:hypothetical protein
MAEVGKTHSVITQAVMKANNTEEAIQFLARRAAYHAAYSLGLWWLAKRLAT